MAGHNQSFPFLDLPTELRTKIYECLLSPNPHQSHTLYHDRGGRIGSFNFFPSILRANTQIYSEAAGVLYERNIFKVHLATPVGHRIFDNSYEDGPLEPGSLFRWDSTLSDEFSGRWTGDSDLIAATDGVIYPHCFQRIRNLELVTSHDALWSPKSRTEYRLTSAGELLQEVLRVLSSDQTSIPSVTNALKLTDEQHICQQSLCQTNTVSRVSAPKRIGFLERRVTGLRREKDRSFTETLKLLRSVQKRRTLSLWEISDSSHDPGRAHYTREVDLAGLDQRYVAD
ncbi:hypothetical protein MMC22_002336 [Lobaria immixta]|nr:hypothetical protein [Lobaria immixta]